MVSGGPRQGTPGTAYTNRSDLNTNRLPATTGPSHVYGDSAALLRSQQAVPMAPPPATVVPPAGGAGFPAAPGPTGPPPVDLHAPSDRPQEPVTHGLPIGPGAGPEALGGALSGDGVADQLRALYAAHPNEDLRALLEIVDSGGV